jgi:hypothetical protein
MAARPRNPLPEHPLFAAFWETYPRHSARFDASQAFAKLAPDLSLLDTILRAIEAQKRNGCLKPRHAADGSSVIPYPASWLRARRWEDEDEATARPRADRGTDYATSTLLDAVSGVVHERVAAARVVRVETPTRGIGNGTTGRFVPLDFGDDS